ncbi:MAG: SDR family NAD(P)-dependent oxidoreductase [Clostridia bacterium]|nr:SDR family NAD(P)-dependent oxidoreductase [Clostridia bacterium]
MNIEKWIFKNSENLFGKTVVISGATGGIGRYLCYYLCYLGAKVILLCRNEKKYTDLKNEITEKISDADLSYIIADLEDFESVKEVCEKLKDIEIDYLIHNAGVYNIPRKLCKTGYNNIFQTNFISPYYMTKELGDNVKKVIAVSSIAHNYSKIDIKDIDFSKRRASSKVYGNSKRFLMFSMLELLKKGEISDLAVAHPGITVTNMTSHYPKLIYAIIKYPMKIIFMKPQIACLSILKAMFEKCDSNFWIGPSLFDIWGMPRKKKIRTAKKDEREKISEISEKIYLELKD